MTLAQKDLLSFDEHNKYIYYQVADQPGLSADTLHYLVGRFLKTTYPKLKTETSAPGSKDLKGHGKFITYSSILVLRHENGEINYVLNIEFKDQKFRYWITDFTFNPYQRDRYGNFVPMDGMNLPLETALTKTDKRDAAIHLDETGAFCKQFTDALKLFLTKPVVIPKKEEETTKKVVTDKW